MRVSTSFLITGAVAYTTYLVLGWFGLGLFMGWFITEVVREYKLLCTTTHAVAS